MLDDLLDVASWADLGCGWRSLLLLVAIALAVAGFLVSTWAAAAGLWTASVAIAGFLLWSLRWDER